MMIMGGVYWLTQHWLTADQQWIGWLAAFLSGAGAWMLGWVTFPILMPLLGFLMQESWVEGFEKVEYPEAVGQYRPSLTDWIVEIKTVAKMLVLNIFLVPFYFIPVLNVALFFGVNSWSLGKEMVRLVLNRHMPAEEHEAFIEHHRWKIWLGTALILGMALLPVINLFVPWILVAYMVHLFHFERIRMHPLKPLLPNQR